MTNVNFNDLLAELEASESTPVIATSGGGSGRYSLGIVNSKSNGKRISISKALTQKLGLTDTVQMAAFPQHGFLMMASTLPSKKASSCFLTGDDKKIGYSADIVHRLTEDFNLDFSEHVSRSFSKVEFEEQNGVCIAYIHICDPIAPNEG